MAAAVELSTCTENVCTDRVPVEYTAVYVFQGYAAQIDGAVDC